MGPASASDDFDDITHHNFNDDDNLHDDNLDADYNASCEAAADGRR